jgi:hypothetical protein
VSILIPAGTPSPDSGHLIITRLNLAPRPSDILHPVLAPQNTNEKELPLVKETLTGYSQITELAFYCPQCAEREFGGD